MWSTTLKTVWSNKDPFTLAIFLRLALRFKRWFCSDLVAILQRYSSRTLKSGNFVPLKVWWTCVEEKLILRPHTYEHVPLVGDPFFLFPFVTFFAVPVFTVSPSMFSFSPKERVRQVLFWGSTKAAFWILSQWKSPPSRSKNSSKIETLSISRRFYLQIAVKSPDLKSPRDRA